MNELDLVRAIRRHAGPPLSKSIVLGIGDDCAILRPPPGHDLLVTTDFLIEDLHFVRSKQTAAEIGWKALARGLSDIAAMGGTPQAALFSLAAAPWVCRNFLADFYKGARKLAALHKVSIVGGDLSVAPRFVCDVTVIGSAPRGKALRRSGARPGDIIAVSGPLGRAAAANYVEHPGPQPRFDAGRPLRKAGATACMDLSDGLAMDLHRLALESGVSAALDGVLPSAPGATLDHALFGGEDYELLATLPPKARLPRGFTRIGVVVKGKPGKVTFAGAPLPPKGWDPLKSSPSIHTQP
jgi:thiamine-monophosphate kinase